MHNVYPVFGAGFEIGGDKKPVNMENKKKGFALPLVLTIMLALSTLALVMMELATDRFFIYSIASERERLYNAAQWGIEWGKAQLWENRNSLDSEQKTYTGELSSLAATKTSGEELAFNLSVPIPSSDMTVEVTVLDCNYDPDSAVYSGDLPPVRLISGDILASSGTPDGTSAVASPDELTFLSSSPEEEHAFLIRSKAIGKDKKRLVVESMVAIRYSEPMGMHVFYWQIKN